MNTPANLNEFTHAEGPARWLLEALGWACVQREALEWDEPGTGRWQERVVGMTDTPPRARRTDWPIRTTHATYK